MGWAWCTLVLCEPDGDPSKAAVLGDAWVVMMEHVHKLVHGRLSSKAMTVVAAGAADCASPDDVAMSLSMSLVEYLGRQLDTRDDRAAKLERDLMDGRPVTKAAGDEAWRLGRLDTSLELIMRERALGRIPRNLWEARYWEGVEHGACPDHWLAHVRNKLSQLMSDELQKANVRAVNQSKKAEDAAMGGRETCDLDRIKASSSALVDAVVDNWFLAEVFPSAALRWSRKRAQIECFREDFLAGGVSAPMAADPAWKRKSGRGRAAICGELFWQMVAAKKVLEANLPFGLETPTSKALRELDGLERALRTGELSSEKSEGRRRRIYTDWAATVADKLELVRSAFASLRAEVDSHGDDVEGAAFILTGSPGPDLTVDYILASCHVMKTIGRKRRPAGMASAGGDAS